jgi:hypothetical protein
MQSRHDDMIRKSSQVKHKSNQIKSNQIKSSQVVDHRKKAQANKE